MRHHIHLFLLYWRRLIGLIGLVHRICIWWISVRTGAVTFSGCVLRAIALIHHEYKMPANAVWSKFSTKFDQIKDIENLELVIYDKKKWNSQIFEEQHRLITATYIHGKYWQGGSWSVEDRSTVKNVLERKLTLWLDPFAGLIINRHCLNESRSICERKLLLLLNHNFPESWSGSNAGKYKFWIEISRNREKINGVA